ncbi:MAG: FAD:protein FMN transferase [Saprospiraceae bacterium]
MIQKIANSILFFCAFVSCQKQVPYTSLTGTAQGTTFTIRYQDKEQRDFSQSVDSLFRLIDKSMSLWDSTSLIRRINRNEKDLKLDQHFINVFNSSREISDLTDGAFDVTVSPLVNAWGFSYKKGLPPPDSSLVDSLKHFIGFKRVMIENGVLQKQDPRIELDFNAIAQGYTVDLVSAFLETHGIKNYLVEIGGEVRASGVNERDSIWMIGIDKPVEVASDERLLQTTIGLQNKSIATSGSYRKFIERDGKKYSHFISPETGYPVQHNLLSVSVMADNCTSADGYATAFMVMGLEKTMDKVKTLHLDVYCIYADGNGMLKTMSTSGFGR